MLLITPMPRYYACLPVSPPLRSLIIDALMVSPYFAICCCRYAGAAAEVAAAMPRYAYFHMLSLFSAAALCFSLLCHDAMLPLRPYVAADAAATPRRLSLPGLRRLLLMSRFFRYADRFLLCRHADISSRFSMLRRRPSLTPMPPLAA